MALAGQIPGPFKIAGIALAVVASALLAIGEE
jgi:hypothetical protein